MAITRKTAQEKAAASEGSDLGSSLIGHQTAAELLARSMQADRLAHAYLFTGQTGVGKTTVALRLAQAFLCTRHQSGQACGQCPACAQVARGSHPDLLRLEPEPDRTALTIEQVRLLIERLSATSLLGGGQVALLPQADLLSTDAAHALLKVLEEPAGRSLLLLCASQPSRLPLTIRSRCQIIRLEPVPAEEIAQVLVQRFPQIERGELKRIAAAALGRPGLALRWAADPALWRDWQAEIDQLVSLWQMPLSQRLLSASQWIASWPDDEIRRRSRDWLSLWQQLCRDALLVHLNLPEQAAFPLSAGQREALQRHTTPAALQRCWELAARARQWLASHLPPRLVFDQLAAALN